MRVLLVLILTLAASDASADIRHRFRTLTEAHGLSSNVVRDVVVAKDGQIWFATMAGISVYRPDTATFRTIDLGPNRREVTALARTKDGALWAGTQDGGVGRLLDGTWTWFGPKDGLPSSHITALFVDKRGNLWVVPTDGGIARRDGTRFHAYGPRDGLTPGEVARCGDVGELIWCGSYAPGEVVQFDGERWHAKQIDVEGSEPFYVSAVLQADDGTIWLGTKGRGVLRSADGKTWQTITTTEGLPSRRVGRLFQDSQRRIWTTTAAGVAHFDGQKWQTFARIEGLGSSHVFAVTEASDGSLWFATLGGGVTRFRKARWIHLQSSGQVPLNDINTVAWLADTLWIGTDQGLFHYHNGSVTPSNLELRRVRQLSVEGNALWIASESGLARWADGKLEQLGPTSDGQPLAVKRFAIAQHKLWVVTKLGLHKHGKPGEPSWVHYGPEHGLPAAAVYDVLIAADGVIWAATTAGVAKFNGDKFAIELPWKTKRSRRARVYRLEQTSDGVIWAAGLAGVNKLRNGVWQLWHSDPLPEGVYSRFMMRTRDDSLWFAVRGMGVLRYRAGRWVRFTTARGLSSDTINDVRVLDDGRLVFATLGGGISIYTPDKHPPQTRAANLRHGTVSRLAGETLALRFSASDPFLDTPQTALQFSYRIDNKPWTPFRNTRVLRLNNLEPGTHNLEVRAMDFDFNVDPAPAQLSIHILRRWWQQPWLIAVVALALLALLGSALASARALRRERAAVNREQAIVSERERFVRLASHELRKPLTRIAHRAELLSLPAQGDHKKQQTHTSAIADDARNLAHLVESLLDQASVEAGLRLGRESRELAPLLDNIVTRFCDGKSKTHLNLESGLRANVDPRYLEMAVQNLLDNAAKYGGDWERVDVSLKRVGPRAVITVRDQGPGIAPEQRARIFEPFRRGLTDPEHGGFGLGLSFAREIARAHGGELRLVDSDTGAIFELAIPCEDSPTS